MLKNLLYCLVLLVGLPFLSQGQDCISNITIETSCIDAFNLTASIEFDYNLEDNDWVAVIGSNGTNYGYFSPNEQPLLLEVLLPIPIMNQIGFTLIRNRMSRWRTF